MHPSNDDDVDPNLDSACRDIIDELLGCNNRSKNFLNALKIKYAKKHGLAEIPNNAAILDKLTGKERDTLIGLLRRRKTRTLSGVSVIAVMTEPIDCPGHCVFCPGKNSQPGDRAAQSYTGKEPAAMRSISYGYDPFKQVSSRIGDLEAIGHECDKIEIIVMGGTFLSSPANYQESFVKGCIDGVLGHQTRSLAEAKVVAETSTRRIIGITFETRPDYCNHAHVDAMLDYGGTRVEIGVQTTHDDIYELVERGHNSQASKRAIQVAKDAGFKVCLHVMPNLPGSSLERDEEAFSTIFSDDDYKPDYLKVYPTLVVPGTRLEQWWREGKYKPYSIEMMTNLLARVKASLPPWVRIQRVQRDIPAYLILDGVKHSNFREVIWEKMKQHGTRCNCIRCMEFGFSRGESMNNIVPVHDMTFHDEYYPASGGTECFITARHPGTESIFGYVRVRKPSPLAHRDEITGVRASIIRELRVVGEVVPVNKVAGDRQVQHRGLGKTLMERAEQVAREKFNAEKVLVISGLGVKPYFFGMGYQKDGPYVSKVV